MSPFARISFSQEGEDLVLARLTEDRLNGFYVDVGAHHPTRFSNTQLLYRRGWAGINIDPTPGAIKLFNKLRPRDINLEAAIGSKPGTSTLYMFDEPALNSTSRELSRMRHEQTDYKVIREVQVPLLTLEDMLDQFLPDPSQTIDLLSIDVEGSDFDVLKSNDWSRFRPRIVLIETLESSVEQVLDGDEYAYLRELGYRLHSKLANTVIFLDAGRGSLG